MKRRELITALGAAAVLMAMISGFAWVKWERRIAPSRWQKERVKPVI